MSSELNYELKGVWIDRSVFFNAKLTPLDKIIITEIDNLCSKENNTGCYASNNYLADFCLCNERSVQRSIKKCKEMNYLKVEFEENKRVIYTRYSNPTHFIEELSTTQSTQISTKNQGLSTELSTKNDDFKATPRQNVVPPRQNVALNNNSIYKGLDRYNNITNKEIVNNINCARACTRERVNFKSFNEREIFFKRFNDFFIAHNVIDFSNIDNYEDIILETSLEIIDTFIDLIELSSKSKLVYKNKVLTKKFVVNMISNFTRGDLERLIYYINFSCDDSKRYQYILETLINSDKEFKSKFNRKEENSS